MAINDNNMDEATEQKSAIEDEQRRKAKERNDTGVEWVPRYFVTNKNVGGDEYFGFKHHDS